MANMKGLASDSLKMRFGIVPNNPILKAKFYSDKLTSTLSGSKKITTASDYAKAKEEAQRISLQKMEEAKARETRIASESLLPKREAVSVVKSLIDAEKRYESKGVTSKGVRVSKKQGKALYEDVKKGMAPAFESLVTFVLKYKKGLIGPGMKDDSFEYRTLVEVNKNPKLVTGVNRLMELL